MNLWNRLMCYCRRRSPWLFHMNSGSCNGCDIELIASLTPRYDAEQLGVRLEGSPRHADILCVTGPVTHNSVQAIKTVYGQVFAPKAVVAIGSCPATTNVFIDSRTLAGPLNKHIPVDVFVPGCPPRPDAIILGIAKAAGILGERGVKKPAAAAALLTAAPEAMPTVPAAAQPAAPEPVTVAAAAAPAAKEVQP
jgi:membrane-bound hydrogenase subunit mbhJ